MQKTAKDGQPAPNGTAKPAPPLLITEDDVIRYAGFRIHARPAKGPVVWIRNGSTIEHEAALTIAQRFVKPIEAAPAEPSVAEAAIEDGQVKF